jgi:nicotinamide-nucleotide adenylyltransferase
MDDMPTRLSNFRSLLPTFESALHSFTSSPSKFRIVHTVHPTSTQPKTLYILDSSFNPPSRAHLSLATSALYDGTGEKPWRLLLLFSTHNADKAPSPASFVQRIALMSVFAEDLMQALRTERGAGEDVRKVSIDIGLTKEPYYTDKSIAIAQEGADMYTEQGLKHVHLVGYDTLTRFCNPKYYTETKPPLSALAPFFVPGHGLRVTLRPSDPSDESSSAFGSEEEQRTYVKNLADGDGEKDGFKKEWAKSIEVVNGGEGVGISSTRVRRAAGEGEWELVRELCSEGVAGWVRDQGLYKEDSSGKKMMG